VRAVGYTTGMLDRARLAAVPEAEVARDAATAHGVAASVAYLGSDAALRSLAVDPYWPKWDSPWWHMVLLHELGEARQIPPRAVAAMVAGLDGLLHSFPIRPEDTAGVDLQRDLACHCALGCMYQVLSACGVDVEQALPWIAPWLARYQMADGGLNCDESAYLVTHECPSSMVGTVPAFEAMLVRGEQRDFLRRAARFLIERRLTEGSPTAHNAAERAAAPAWRQPTFPRFYFYDVLRGLGALVRWAELTGDAVPAAAVQVASELAARFPDGVVRVERQAWTAHGTIQPADPAPRPRSPASRFALLDATSAIGTPSEALTRGWTAARQALIRLIDAGQIIA